MQRMHDGLNISVILIFMRPNMLKIAAREDILASCKQFSFLRLGISSTPLVDGGMPQVLIFRAV